MSSVLDALSCISGLNITIFDSNRNIISDSTETGRLFNSLYLSTDYPDILYDYSRRHSEPYIISNYMGLVWEAVFVLDPDKNENICLLGPVLYNSVSETELNRLLSQYEKSGLKLSSRRRLIRAIQELPLMTFTQFAQLAQMLDYSLNRKNVPIDSFASLSDTEPHIGSTDTIPPENIRPLDPASSNPLRRHYEEHHIDESTYESCRRCEDLLLSEIRLGIIGSSSDQISPLLQKGAFTIMPTEAAEIKEPLRMRRDTLLIYNALACRTAVEAGVLTGTAYACQDRYVKEIEAVHTPLGLNELQTKLQREYCRLVADAKAASASYSEITRKCMARMQADIKESLSVSELAKAAGCSAYYASKIFKKDTGETPKEYFLILKINYAATLIKNTDDSITSIAELLNYGSYAHFCSDFKAVLGCPPSQLRS